MADKSYLTLGPAFPIGIRRNNPGNLRKGKNVQYPGLTNRQDSGRGPLFYAFENMAYGMRAMIQLVISRITKSGLDTIAKMGPNYAPPKENNTAEWIATVAKKSGIKSTAKLGTDKETIKKLVLAIASKEVGSPWRKNGIVATIDAQDFEDGWALLQPPPLV